MFLVGAAHARALARSHTQAQQGTLLLNDAHREARAAGPGAAAGASTHAPEGAAQGVLFVRERCAVVRRGELHVLTVASAEDPSASSSADQSAETGVRTTRASHGCWSKVLCAAGGVFEFYGST